MSTFDDREKGFEKKFAHDAEQDFKAAARRNRMLAEWAAGLMGLESVEEYVRAVVKAERSAASCSFCGSRAPGAGRGPRLMGISGQ